VVELFRVKFWVLSYKISHDSVHIQAHAQQVGQIATSARVRSGCLFHWRILCNDNIAETNPESRYPHLTDVQVAKCLAVAKGGIKQRAIATEIGCSKSTIGRIIKYYRFETFVQRTPPRRPTLETSTSDNRHFIVTPKCHFDQPL